MNRPSTFNEIDGLIDHIIANELTKDEELLSKIYVDLGCTAGNIFKLRFEEKTGESVPDPYGSWYPIEETTPRVPFFKRLFRIA